MSGPLITKHFFLLIATVLFLQTTNCYGLINTNNSKAFAGAVATWYGPATGPGSGGACGLQSDVGNAPYNGMITAGNNALFQGGKGCGACYQVRCTQSPLCSGNPITVTMTDQCPGACNNDPVHFDLSGKAFGAMAKSGQDNALRQLGRVNIDYQRVPCNYGGANILIAVTSGSNNFFLAFAVENVNGDGDVGLVEVKPSNSGAWISMTQDFGLSWKTQLPNGSVGPFSVRITTLESKKSVTADNAIPANWAPNGRYQTRVNV